MSLFKFDFLAVINEPISHRDGEECCVKSTDPSSYVI